MYCNCIGDDSWGCRITSTITFTQVLHLNYTQGLGPCPSGTSLDISARNSRTLEVRSSYANYCARSYRASTFGLPHVQGQLWHGPRKISLNSKRSVGIGNRSSRPSTLEYNTTCKINPCV